MNGPLSSSKRTKHIKAKHYLAKNYSDKGDIKFSYLPTDKMWIDMHTKPKQGTPFRTDRAKLMNCPINYDDDTERANTHPSLLPEFEVQTSAIGRPKTPSHRGSVLRNKHKVNTPGISQTPEHTEVAASGIGQTAPVTVGHQLLRKPTRVRYSDVARRLSLIHI